MCPIRFAAIGTSSSTLRLLFGPSGTQGARAVREKPGLPEARAQC